MLQDAGYKTLCPYEFDPFNSSQECPMPIYALDTTGSASANRITGEQIILTPSVNRYNVIVPAYSPFYAQGLSISYRDLAGATRTLVEGQDYNFTHAFVGASRATGRPIYGSIELLNLGISGVATLVYQTLGGPWTATPNQISDTLSDVLRNPRTTTWEVVANVPQVFPPVPHPWDTQDLVGQSDLVAVIAQVAAAIAARSSDAININLPAFYPTKARVGLGNVDNFKTVTDAQAVAGSSATVFMTPRGVALYVSAALSSYEATRAAKYRSATMPAAGAFTTGDYVECTDLTRRTVTGSAITALNGASYLTKGWKRMTTSSTHVLGTDWIEDKMLII
jgi:hypothetical protein